VAALGLVHVVRADQHRDATGGQLVQLLPEVAAGLGSTPAVGSSSSSSCGSCSRHAASARRCFHRRKATRPVVRATPARGPRARGPRPRAGSAWHTRVRRSPGSRGSTGLPSKRSAASCSPRCA
jgi:hypothetical protein